MINRDNPNLDEENRRLSRRGNYPRIPEHSDLRGFSYSAPRNYDFRDDHPVPSPERELGRLARGSRAPLAPPRAAFFPLPSRPLGPPPGMVAKGTTGPDSFWNSVRRFMGVGPKNYRRTDERIFEEACETLADHPAIDASEIEVQVQDGVVILRGSVHDRWTKRAAEWAVERIRGVHDVRNELLVQSWGDKHLRSA